MVRRTFRESIAASLSRRDNFEKFLRLSVASQAKRMGLPWFEALLVISTGRRLSR
jgi:hypothetical protein